MLDSTMESRLRKKDKNGLIGANLISFAQENLTKRKKYHKHTHKPLPPLIKLDENSKKFKTPQAAGSHPYHQLSFLECLS